MTKRWKRIAGFGDIGGLKLTLTLDVEQGDIITDPVTLSEEVALKLTHVVESVFKPEIRMRAEHGEMKNGKWVP